MAQSYYQAPYMSMYGTPTYMQPQMQRMDQQYVPMQQPTQPQPQVQTYNKPVGLQGKSVDSVDVVKAMDIPLDGSISYFPLTDGSAIVTKQLQADGTSKTTIYKPVENAEEKKATYITDEQLKEELKNVNGKEIKNINEEIKSIKREIRHILDDLKDKMED